ncbi:hypothetical protein MIDIC_90003 [Alphaproteobacteria bacterium]
MWTWLFFFTKREWLFVILSPVLKWAPGAQVRAGECGGTT